MSKEILIVVESLSHEKGVPKEVIFDALESALATATKKRYQEDAEFRVAIDRESGNYETFRRWEVIDPDRELEEDETPNPDAELTPEEARERNPALVIGDFHEIGVESVEFGRIAAQAARQVLTQKVREAERAQVLEKYLPRVSQLVSGSVKKVTRDAVIVDLGGNAEAILMRGSMIPRETFRMGDRLRALLVDVRPEARGPQLILSRTTAEMLIELFKVEVPEIAEDVIEIRAAARNPGSRAKIAVYTNDGRIDPVGACVGMRGSRVQAVSGELAGERVDIVLWNENPAQLAINAMQPAEVASIVLDEDTHAMDIAVAEDNLAQAIGQRGENVRLASQLTGWELNIMTEEDAARQQEEEALSYMGVFMETLSVDENVAAVLAEEGFTTVEEVAYVPLDELRGIEGFDEEIVEELRQRAKDALLTKAIASGGLLAEGEPAPDLLGMEGMDRELAYTLAGSGVVTMEDLAELATPDLLDIDESIGEERASELIMTARAPWFEDEGDEETGEAGDVAEVAAPGTDAPGAGEGNLAAAADGTPVAGGAPVAGAPAAERNEGTPPNMSEVTVKQLAAAVGASADRLLQQMREAGLPQQAEDEPVTDQERQRLLEFLNHRQEVQGRAAPSRITLKRTSVTTLKTGQGRGGRTVQVQSKRRRTYVKATPRAEAEADAATAAAPQPGQVELEAERIRQQELARKSAEEDVRRLAARKAEEQAEKEQERERERAREEQEAEAKRREDEVKKQAAQLEAQAKTEERTVTEEAARAQAEAQAQERGGKRVKDRTKDRERAKDPGFGTRRRGELSMKRRSPRMRRRMPSRISVETRGGEFERPQDAVQREVEVGEAIQVGELARRMSVKAGEVIKTLMDMGVMATINQTLDQDTASLLVEEMGHKVKFVVADEVEHEHEESLRIEGEMEGRSPVVTVMGHVDHGKTSLLDHIRNSRIVAGEAGGITQHIGAYRVSTEHGDISFLDTPGHAAFTAMRARGARSTDIVILVVAGDDGVMPQTVEAVQHAKAAGVPIIVAINKMDLEGVDPARIRNELVALDVIPEELGGDTQFIEVSAQTGQGVGNLLESINLQAELLELAAARDVPGRGIVVESRLDRGRGPVATVLVQNGMLRRGDVVIAGERFGRVRLMLNERGDPVSEAGPSVPVEVLGLNGTPEAGDDFSVVADERRARELAELRATRSQEQRLAKQQAAKIENLFANLGEGEKRVLKLVLKADVRGSLEAITQACAELGNDEVAVNLLGTGVGGITESDATLAMTYGAAIFGFNVRADTKAKSVIEREGIDLRYYSVIYELLDDIRMILQDMLAPELREEIVGTAEVRDVFRSPRFGQVAGCMVVDGAVARNKKIRVLRDNVVIFEGELESLRRFKDDVGEVRNGLECGIGVRNYNDVRVGDRIEVFESREVARAL